MTLSRMHLGMLGTVSIFTGMISPVVKNTVSGVPFPLTNLQIPGYFILLSLAVICIFLALKLWSLVRILGIFILILLGYLFIIAWSGEVKATTGILAPSLSWGWIFLAIGSGLIASSIFGKEDIENEVPTISDHLLGWLGAATILALTGLIISISYIPTTGQVNKNPIIGSILSSGSIETHSGITRSIPFASIEKMTFDRAKNTLSFFTSSGTDMVYIPGQRVFNRLPYAVTTIGEVTYIVSAEGLITNLSGAVIGKAIIPQSVDDSILMESGSQILSLGVDGMRRYPGEYMNIESLIKTKKGEHSIWKSRTGSGYAVYIDGNAIGGTQNEIIKISASSDGKSIMTLVRETDGSQYIMKNDIKVEKISQGYIQGTLRMNGTDSLYAVERDGSIELIQNGILIDRKFDEIREIYLDTDGSGYVYFGRPLGEKTYCLYTKYRGNLCGFSGYMNPEQSSDSSVIYAGLKDGTWGIYRNTTTIIRNTGYPNREDISRDYVFFDTTNPSYYLFIRGDDAGYQLYKKGAWVDGIWKDVGLDVAFGYDNKVIMSAQDNSGWRLIEF